jgi:hypothetical protein
VTEAPIRPDDSWERRSDGITQMRRPLADADYLWPVAELYEQDSWKFYTMYWPQNINGTQPPRPARVRQVVSFLTVVVRAVSALSREAAAGESPEVQLAVHLRRERSAKMARLAKVRDGFTCRVCGLNFVELYGPLGRGFAEVHHRVPLSAPHASKVTRLEDLVTVCANCHRMLHRLLGSVDGIKTLSQRFTGRWPGRPTRHRSTRAPMVTTRPRNSKIAVGGVSLYDIGRWPAPSDAGEVQPVE